MRHPVEVRSIPTVVLSYKTTELEPYILISVVGNLVKMCIFLVINPTDHQLTRIDRDLFAYRDDKYRIRVSATRSPSADTLSSDRNS